MGKRACIRHATHSHQVAFTVAPEAILTSQAGPDHASPLSIEAVHWKVTERFACDKKKAAQVYMLQNAAPQCLFSSMEAVIANYGCEVPNACLIHTKKNHAYRPACRVGSADEQAQIMVIGFPCAPFSQQRDKSKPGYLTQLRGVQVRFLHVKRSRVDQVC